MRWIAPTEKDTGTVALEKRLWDAADELRANSGLKASEYSTPVLGLIFLRFADSRFAAGRPSWTRPRSAMPARHAASIDPPTTRPRASSTCPEGALRHSC